MIRALSSRYVRLATLTLFLIQTSACTTTMHAPMTQSVKPEKITGVTLKSGRNIPFDPVGATIVENVFYANGPNGQVVIPADSVENVWTKEVSTSKTIGAVLIGAAVLGIFFVVANKTAGQGSGGY